MQQIFATCHLNVWQKCHIRTQKAACWDGFRAAPAAPYTGIMGTVMNEFQFDVEDVLNLPPGSEASRAFIGKLVRGSVAEGEVLNVEIEGKEFSLKVIYCEVYKRTKVREMNCSDNSHGISITIMNNEKEVYENSLREMRKNDKSIRNLILKKSRE